MVMDFNWFYKYGATNAHIANVVLQAKADSFANLIQDPVTSGAVHFHFGLAGYEFTYTMQISQNGMDAYFKFLNGDLVPSSFAEMQAQKNDYLAQTQIRSFGEGVVFGVNVVTTSQDMPPAGVPTRCSFSREQVLQFLEDNQDFIWSNPAQKIPNPTAKLRIDNGAAFLPTYGPAGYENDFKLQVPVLSFVSDGIWRVNDNPVNAGQANVFFEKGLDIGALCPPDC